MFCCCSHDLPIYEKKIPDIIGKKFAAFSTAEDEEDPNIVTVKKLPHKIAIYVPGNAVSHEFCEERLSIFVDNKLLITDAYWG